MSFSKIREYCKSAEWKSSRGLKPHEYFTDHRESISRDGFKGMASDVMMLYPVIRQLVESAVVPTGAMKPDVLASFRGMHTCLILVQDMKNTGVTQAKCAALTRQQQVHMTAFAIAHDASTMKPKHHYAMHLPAQFLREGRVIDAFTLERKHRISKNYATHTRRLDILESSVAARVLDDILRHTDAISDGLIGPQGPDDSIARVLGASRAVIGEHMVVKGRRLAADDVWIFDNSVAIVVIACVIADGAYMGMGSQHNLSRSEAYAKIWTKTHDLVAFEPTCNDWKIPQFWTYDGASLVTLE